MSSVVANIDSPAIRRSAKTLRDRKHVTRTSSIGARESWLKGDGLPKCINDRCLTHFSIMETLTTTEIEKAKAAVEMKTNTPTTIFILLSSRILSMIFEVWSATRSGKITDRTKRFER